MATKIQQRLTGIKEAIDEWGASPQQAEKALKRAARIASAAGYREGLKTLQSAGLDRNVIRGRSRWFVGYHVGSGAEVEIDLWLGRNPLTGENLPGLDRDKRMPDNIDALLDRTVVPVIIKVLEREVQNSLRRQAILG